ncbi:lambda C [Pycnonotidae orthoreovirus]|uniref:Lambda C n=1 Tax=Pycnonotidae orthoreovirus TaxID=3070176 RepID=A0A0B6VK18_9REOV|nr:lambda C [Avian orthoreovirus]BAQ19495.1 lambda C [Avian orthoreovirus]
MAQIRGLRLSGSLSIPSVQSHLQKITYDEFLGYLAGEADPWIQLHNPSERQPVCVQLLFPLQGLQTPSLPTNAPQTYDEWAPWMRTQLKSIYEYIIAELPISQYHGRQINPIVANAFVSARFMCTPANHLLPHLMVKVSPVDDILDNNVSLHDHFWRHTRNIVCSVAGLKYIKFQNYTYDDGDPCLFAKDVTPYALAYYTRDLTTAIKLSDGMPDVDTCLIHVDRPTYGFHTLVPSHSVVGASGSSLFPCSAWLLLESSVDQLVSNHLSANRRPMSRLIDSYLVARAPSFSNQRSLEYSLLCLNNAAFNGHQFAFQHSKKLTCREATIILTQLSDYSKPINVPLPYPRSFTIYSNLEMQYPDPIVPFIRRVGPRFEGSSGVLTYTKDVARSIAWQPQFDLATQYDLQSCIDDFNSALTLPLKPNYGDAWSGEPFVTSSISRSSDLSYPLTSVPDVPADYFSLLHVNSRAKFASYRRVRDRSYYKDVAVLSFVSSVTSSGGSTYLKNGMSAAYLGASGTHDGDEPTVIQDWIHGKLQRVFKPAFVKQYGWEVTKGVILDVERPFASGTFSFVYSDVDQAQVDSNDLMSSNRHFILQLSSMLELISPGGTLVVKCNFPTLTILRHLFTLVSPRFESLGFIKPMLNNNLELYIACFGKLANPGQPYGPSTATVQFLRQHHSRYTALIAAFTDVPHRDAVLMLDDPLTMASLNFVDVTSLRELPDLRALAAFSLFGHLPTMTIAVHPYFDSYRTNLSALVTPASRNLFNRLASVPHVYPSTINIQTRSIKASSPTIFGYRASHWTLLSMFYDHVLATQQWFNGLWLDLGTGPECRILSRLPPHQPLVMVDTRPAIYPMSCWKTHTEYLQMDYTQVDVISMRPPIYLSMILTLGAAAADAHLPLRQLITLILNQAKQNNVVKLALQVNSPMFDSFDIPSSILNIDRQRGLYIFPELGREEPYIELNDLVNLIRDVYPQAVIEIRSADLDLSWLISPFSNGVGVSTTSVSLAMQLSRCCPLILIHTDVVAAQFSPNPQVGTEISITINGYDVTSGISINLDGVELMRYEASAFTSIVPNSSAQVTGNTLTIKFIPQTAGLLDVYKDNGTRVPLGSTAIQVPDTSLTLVWPRVADQSDTGTNVEVYVNDWFQLRLYAERDGNVFPVSDDKYDFRTNSVWLDQRVLNVVLDRSDAFYKFFLMDVQSGVPGLHIRVEVTELTAHVWNADQPSFLSPPSDSDYVINTDDGPIPLYRPFTNIPITWQFLDTSTSADASLPSFLVPPGSHYGIVQIQ